MAFDAHVASGRDAFITNDTKAFVSDGRRKQLQDMFDTRIFTREEFESYLAVA